MSAAVEYSSEVIDTATATATATQAHHPMPEQAHMYTPQRSELKEQFDEDGDVLAVGNLTFVEGILGTGSYGTVRLAHRRSWTPPSTNASTPTGTNKKRIRDTHGFARSASEPTDSTFFRHAAGRIEKSQSSLVGDLFASPFKKEKNSNDLVAVKIFNKSILKRMRTMERDKATNKVQVKTAYEKVEREIALMKKFSHPNLVALYDVIDSPESDNLYMVLEYMPLGEILTYQGDGTFRRTGHRPMEGVIGDGHFDEAHAALYFVDILHALAYLHQHHICHRDLKPENILLDARGIVKISDFGVSHFFEEDQDIGAQRLAHAQEHHPTKLTRSDTDSALQMAGMADTGFLTKTEGTWCFWSPAMCSSSSKPFSGYAADMWAAGVCLYIFVTGKLPFFSQVPTELFDLIAQADVPYQGLGLSNSLLDLLKATLEKDETKRAGVGDCLNHPFLEVARTKRIRQLSAEFRESKSRTLVVGEDDILRVRNYYCWRFSLELHKCPHPSFICFNS
jgi:[calcium/calmodulin-dependent protein kinase] kinase